MRHVQRSEILDFVTYGERRDAIRAAAMAEKERRRVHLGPHLTFLFENHGTVRYQVLEMVRAEQMVKESDIQHELDTYNALMGERGELGCTLLIEITDEKARPDLLRRWRDLPRRIVMTFDEGSEAYAVVDEDQFNEEKASSVQFLRFPVRGRAPKGLRVDHEDYRAETTFTADTRQALMSDLAD
ncbi:MAG TPA: DUF3501 family protein [Holophagaceae bacterium]|nr:DUF3501 family protein [Holophagaceae bacterium]